MMGMQRGIDEFSGRRKPVKIEKKRVLVEPVTKETHELHLYGVAHQKEEIIFC
jgi:hypothetical protein